MTSLDRRLSIAPMMDHTDRHYRYFLRLISQSTLLYTEMITTGALLYGDYDHFLAYSEAEHPLAIQLGGSDPDELSRCAKLAENYHYDEVNLNIGCPSDRVQNGRFGACLMAEPQLVADCISAMSESCSLPITVKTRLGIDDRDSYEELIRFVDTVKHAGCKTFILHARKAWLQGLSPKQNREIPPLEYEKVYRIAKDFPDLEIIINGGFTRMEQIQEQYEHVNGVMIGRAAYQNPFLLAKVDKEIFGLNLPQSSREEVISKFIVYAQEQLALGVSLNHMTRHILGLYQGQAGARAFRRYISQHAYVKGAGIEVLQRALDVVKNHKLETSSCS